MIKSGRRLFTTFLLLFLLKSFLGITQTNTSQEQVLKLIETYHYEEALNLTELLLQNDSNSTDYILLKTRCLAAFGKYSEASVYLLKALKTDSNNIKVLSSLIEMLSLSGNPDKACIYACRRCNIEPSNRFFKYSLANLYYQSELYNKGLSLLISLYRDDSNSTSLQKQIVTGLYELRKYDSAMLFCHKMLKTTPYNPWAVNKMANIYIRLSDYKSGITLTESFLQHDSTNTNILKSNAYLYYLSKDFPTSEYHFERCINHGDSSIFSFKYLALAQYQQEKFRKAYRNFTTAYSLDTTDTELCFYYGLTSAKNGMQEIGLIYLNKALSRLKASETFSSKIYIEIASIFNEMEKQDTALTLLVKAFERSPTSPDILFRIAYQYDTYLNDPTSSIKYYQRYLASNPQKNESKTSISDNAIEVNLSKYDYANRRLKALQTQGK